jgi:superfamily I DNA/RNA helicase
MRTHTLTPEQLDCINFPGDQLLIRGAPGSGKTTTLLYRALALAERRQSPDETIYVFSYNKTLASYARHLVAGVTDPPITVTNFHRWAWQQLFRQRLLPSRRDSVLQDREREQVIAGAANGVRASLPPERSHKVLESGRQFWADEIEWIKGRMIEDLSVYEGVIRAGRRDALRIPARRVVWQVYEAYQAELRRLRKLDFDDFALLLLHHWEEVPDEHQIDHILIDESQDFQAAQLETLSRFTRKTITIVADEGQRIYKRSFTWTDLGIEVVGGGRARVLKQTFRPTRQILAFAKGLRLEESLGKYADLPPVDIGEPERDGPIPLVTAVDGASAASHAEYSVAADLLAALTARVPEDTIGVLARRWQTVDEMARVLESRGLTYDRVQEHDGDVITPGVKLTTFHSAKGLEFDQVVLIGVDEGSVPQPPDADMTPEEGDDHLRYERRLLYVAMTRARDALYIIHGLAPSPFLAELDPATYQRHTRVAQPVPAAPVVSAFDDTPF